MNSLIRILWVAFLLTQQIECRAQQDEAIQVDELVGREMKTQHIPGLSLGVVRAGQVILAKGYGLANVEHQVPVKPETVFQSGSMGKQFTATAIMMLVEARKIGLDDTVRKYLTNAPSSWEKIRVRHLLNTVRDQFLLGGGGCSGHVRQRSSGQGDQSHPPAGRCDVRGTQAAVTFCATQCDGAGQCLGQTDLMTLVQLRS